MKAIVLAAGRGKRLKEVTAPVNKCMLKFHERYLIEYSLESASLGNVDEIIIVVGYRAEDIINTFGITYKGTRIQYVFQEEQTGLVNAIEQCRKALGGADFILHLADELLINPRPMEMIKAFQDRDLFVVCGATRVEDRELIKRTYSVIYNPDNNQIYRLIEKPRNPFNDIMGTGNCVFRNEILDFIQFAPIHYVRKEKELPDLIQCAIDDGMEVELFFIATQYININTQEDIELAERLLP